MNKSKNKSYFFSIFTKMVYFCDGRTLKHEAKVYKKAQILLVSELNHVYLYMHDPIKYKGSGRGLVVRVLDS